MELNLRNKVSERLNTQTLAQSQNISHEAARQVYARFRPGKMERESRFANSSDDTGVRIVRLVERESEPGIYDVASGRDVLQVDSLNAYDIASFPEHNGAGAALQPMGPLGSAVALKNACKLYAEQPGITPEDLMEQSFSVEPAVNDPSHVINDDVAPSQSRRRR